MILSTDKLALLFRSSFIHLLVIFSFQNLSFVAARSVNGNISEKRWSLSVMLDSFTCTHGTIGLEFSDKMLETEYFL